MFDQDDLKAVATAFVAAAERGDDARAGGAVAEAAATARLRLGEWEAAGAGLPRCEPLLQATERSARSSNWLQRGLRGTACAIWPWVLEAATSPVLAILMS